MFYIKRSFYISYRKCAKAYNIEVLYKMIFFVYKNIYSTVTGLEPATAGSEVQRAIQLRHTVIYKPPTGVEPVTSCLLGRCSNQLSHKGIFIVVEYILCKIYISVCTMWESNPRP